MKFAGQLSSSIYFRDRDSNCRWRQSFARCSRRCFLQLEPRTSNSATHGRAQKKSVLLFQSFVRQNILPNLRITFPPPWAKIYFPSEWPVAAARSWCVGGIALYCIVAPVRVIIAPGGCKLIKLMANVN